MKRSHDAATSSSAAVSSASDGRSGLLVPPGPSKTGDPLQSESNLYVRSILRAIGHGDGATSEDEIEGYVDPSLCGSVETPVGRDICYGEAYRRKSFCQSPPKPPGEGASMEAISVYYSVEKLHGHADQTQLRIDGLVFHFEDGGELDLFAHRRKKSPGFTAKSDSNVVVMRLDEGEAITGTVVALWAHYAEGRPGVRYLTGIRVHTSKSRILEVKPEGCWGLNEEKHDVPEGQVLRTIQFLEVPNFDTFALGSYDLITIETEGILTDDSPPLPSLASLARNAEIARLQSRAKEVEMSGRAKLLSAKAKRKSAWDEIVRSTRVEVQDSREAAEVRRLQAELNAAQDRLSERMMKSQAAMESKLKKARDEEQNEQRNTKNYWRTERTNVLEEHEAFLGMAADRMGDGAKRVGYSLCKSPDCRLVYQRKKMFLYKRCCAEGCQIDAVNCGCDVAMCKICSRFLCSYHMKAHVDKCKATEEDTLQQYDVTRESWGLSGDIYMNPKTEQGKKSRSI